MKQIIIFTLLVIFSSQAHAFNLSKIFKNADHSDVRLTKQVFYSCNNAMTMDVSYYKNAAIKNLGSFNNPVPDKAVYVVLSEGLEFPLLQSQALDNSHYENKEEDLTLIVGKEKIHLLENSQKIYKDCVIASKGENNLPQSFTSEFVADSFSIRYPSNYSIDTNFEHNKVHDYGKNEKYEFYRKKKDFVSVKFHIPLSDKSNLLKDTGVSVEQIPDAKKCDSRLFIKSDHIEENKDNDVEYLVARAKDSGFFGKRYEEEVWVIPDADICTAIRYFIYYQKMSTIDPKKNIKAFNRPALIKNFHEIRQSLILND